MSKTIHALSADELAAEMKVIAECWALLSKLDNNARYRVLDWLANWRRAETEGDGGIF